MTQEQLDLPERVRQARTLLGYLTHHAQHRTAFIPGQQDVDGVSALLDLAESAGRMRGALRRLKAELTIPAAEYVPAIPACWAIIDAALSPAQSTEGAAEENDVTVGLIIAASIVIQAHDEPSVASTILNAAGVKSAEEALAAGAAPYDIDILAPLFAEAHRHRRPTEGEEGQ